MSYLHTNVYISEFSKKYVYFNPYFLGDLAFMRIILFIYPLKYGVQINIFLSETACLMHIFSRKILIKGLVHPTKCVA